MSEFPCIVKTFYCQGVNTIMFSEKINKKINIKYLLFIIHTFLIGIFSDKQNLYTKPLSILIYQSIKALIISRKHNRNNEYVE